MRKIVSLIICICAVFALCAASPAYARSAYADTIKIGLFYGNGAKETVVIGSESGFYMGCEADGVFTADLALTDAEVTVSAGEGNTVTIGAHVYAAENEPILYPVSGNIFIDGTEYRGGVQFKRTDGGALTVINIVNLEEYLYSVIGKEMSPSWNLEALKAQAVCARGFAISNYTKFSSYGFNLDSTSSSQVYKGVSTETESTRRAVEETRGLVLKYGGEIAQSVYCASMGGATASSESVWGGAYPYLVSVTDPYENPGEASYYSWTTVLTAEEIKECLASSDVNIGDIVNVEIISRDSAGYVLELLFTGTEGVHTVKKSTCRSVFNGKLKSQRYTVASSSANYESISVISSSGTSSMPFNELGIVNSGKSSSVYALSASSVRAYAPSGGASAENEYTFNGNGWGHGVGMSQWGAKAMADQGHTFDEILTFYYTGTHIENISESEG